MSTTPREELERLLLVARRALRRWWVIVACALVGGGAGLGYGELRRKTYESETLVLYREVAPVTLVQGSGDGSRDLGQRVGDMLMTRKRLEGVIGELGLYKNVVKKQGMAEAVELMRRDVMFRAHGTGSTFLIRYRAPSPDLAQKVTERLAQSLIDDDTSLRAEQANVTTSFVKAERDRADVELRGKEKALAEFLAAHPAFALEQSDGSAGAAVRVTSPANVRDPHLEGRLFGLQRQRDRLAARLIQADRPIDPTPGADLAAAQARIDAARRELDDAHRELNEKLASYTERHPDVVAARKRVADAGTRLKEAEAAAPRATPGQVLPLTPAERAAIEERIAEIDDEIGALRRQASVSVSPLPAPRPPPGGREGLVELETQWRRITREVDEARERAQVLENRLLTAQILATSELQGQATRMQVIDPAFRPTRPMGAPRRLLVIVGALLFGLLGAAVVFALAWLDDRITAAPDVERLGLGPVLAFIPGPGKRAAELPQASEGRPPSEGKPRRP